MSVLNGKNKRSSLNRFFHIVNLGWYAESREGNIGPFLSYSEARNSLLHHIKNSRLRNHS